MQYEGLKLGFALTGSHCTIPEVLIELKNIVDLGVDVTAIISESVATTDTRFGKAEDVRKFLEETTGKPVIDSIAKAEPIGPKKLFDCLVIAPCTGNTLAKIAHGIVDTPVVMAAKAHMRNLRPLVIAISTNDGLSTTASNLGKLLQTKNVYFVPFGQDNPKSKPNSLIARNYDIMESITLSLEGSQVQPLLIERWKDAHSA